MVLVTAPLMILFGLTDWHIERHSCWAYCSTVTKAVGGTKIQSSTDRCCTWSWALGIFKNSKRNRPLRRLIFNITVLLLHAQSVIAHRTKNLSVSSQSVQKTSRSVHMVLVTATIMILFAALKNCWTRPLLCAAAAEWTEQKFMLNRPLLHMILGAWNFYALIIPSATADRCWG